MKLNWFKKKDKKEKKDEYSFQWLEIGKDNPFNKRILDVRSLTWSVIATTTDKNVAESYNYLRNSNGEEYIDKDIENGETIEASLEYPHNGNALEGIVFKSDSMECKWDIYIYNNIFYFTRSWLGELVYKAHAEILADRITIHKIEFPQETGLELAKSDIHFLLKTHAMGQVLPHQIPHYLDSDINIALYSFRQFGNKGCYACFEDITDTVVTLIEK